MNIPGSIETIQVEETSVIDGISMGTLRRMGATINDLLANGLIYPVGTIKQAFLSEAQFQNQMGDTWVLMDGRDVTGSDYATTTGNTTLPDARGTFMRMKDNGAGRDQLGDLALGSYEEDNTPYHTHGYSISFDGAVVWDPTVHINPGSGGGQPLPSFAGTVIADLTVQNAGAGDTRPKNLTANFFIKINLVSNV